MYKPWIMKLEKGQVIGSKAYKRSYYGIFSSIYMHKEINRDYKRPQETLGLMKEITSNPQTRKTGFG